MLEHLFAHRGALLYPYNNPLEWNSQEELFHFCGIFLGGIIVTFAERLSDLMQRDGITKYRLSKLAECSATTVTNWLSGKEVTQSYLQKLSEIFSVSTDYLLGVDDQKEKPLVNGDEELTEYLEELRTRPEMRMLFQLTSKATKADVEKAVKIVEALLEKEGFR